MHRATQHQHTRGHHHAQAQASAQQSSPPVPKPAKAYNPRHPEHTLLYRTVAEHFETWLELASAGQLRRAGHELALACGDGAGDAGGATGGAGVP